MHGLNRRTARGHKRSANDLPTAAYLRAAEWLIQRNLGPDSRHDIADPDDPHSENGALWRDFYARFLDARGLRMRAGCTLDDCVTMLSAMADGLALRAVAEADDPGRPGGATSLLGKAALAVILGCTEPAAASPGPSLDQAVAALLTGSR